MFPVLDPIPLPAPVWLMKVLHLLTLALHFAAVQLLLGGLLFGSIWAVAGRMRKSQPMLDASGAIAHRLPIIMTYVINLGVPPLLFAQVLYGRALYSSSVLIGAWWIAVVGLLMLSYTFLYIMSSRATAGKAWGWVGLIALLVTAKIGYIYTANMTLMIRPEVWDQMYRTSAVGAQLNSGDPTVLPRFFFMMAGGIMIGGIGMMLLSLKKTIDTNSTAFLRRWGGAIAAAGAFVQAVFAVMSMRAQPAGVAEAVSSNGLWYGAEIGWMVTAFFVVVCGAIAFVRSTLSGWLLPTGGAFIAFLNISCAVIVRDGIRDATLLAYGFDVWDRTVASNWIVIIAFLLLFVAGLGILAWLTSVVARAQGVQERYA